MTPNSLALRAYGRAAAPTKTPRALEYEAVARITHRLKLAAQKGTRSFPELAAALHDNRRLWTLLATDLATPGNELPKGLKAQLFFLAEFTQVHSAKVLSGDASVRPLLEVNMSILRGLRGTAEKVA